MAEKLKHPRKVSYAINKKETQPSEEGLQSKRESYQWRGQTQITTGVAILHWRTSERRERTEGRHGCRVTALGQVGNCKIFGAGYVAITFTLPK